MKTLLKKVFALTAMLLVNAVAFATTDVKITVPGDLPYGEGYLMTYVNFNSSLDFTNAEGIKAYAAKKKSDKDGTIQSLTLTPVERVPAGMALLIKADEAGDYLIPITDTPDAVTTDLVAVSEPLDLYDAITSSYGAFVAGPTLLMKGQYFDFNTWSEAEAVGFFAPTMPAAAGTDILPAGSVYLPITQADNWGWSPGYVALKFADAPSTATECTTIAEVRALAEGTEFALSSMGMQATVVGQTLVLLQDETGGIFVSAEDTDGLNAGDLLMGTVKGIVSRQIGVSAAEADLSGLMVAMSSEPVVTEPGDLATAFEDGYLQQLVKLTNLTVHISDGKLTVEDEEGASVQLTTVIYAEGIAAILQNLKDGDIIEEMTGCAVISDANSIYVQYGITDAYFFDPVTITLKEDEPAGNYEAELSFDSSRLPNWQFPTEVKKGEALTIPYIIESYADDLKNVVVTLVVDNQETDSQTFETIAADPEMGIGEQLGSFSYTPSEDGQFTFKLTMTFDGAEETLETEEVTILVTPATGIGTVLAGKTKAEMFDLQGRRVAAPVRGVYVVDGKKVVLK